MQGRASGLAYKQIALILKISPHTVKHHVSRSLRKLDVECSLQAVSLFLKQPGTPSIKKA